MEWRRGGSRGEEPKGEERRGSGEEEVRRGLRGGGVKRS